MAFPSRHYTILPCDYESVTQWAPKFIEFRLNALKSAPQCTTSSYELEAAIPQQEWISTLSKPVFRVLLCVSRNIESQGPVHVWDSEWVGVLCMYGPRYNDKEDCLESTWYLGGGFVSPLHRGRSTLRDIYNFGIQQATNTDRSLAKNRQSRTGIEIIAKANDAPTLRYYRTGGLEVTQSMTLGEYYAQAGWSFSISADLLGLKIVVMRMVIEREAAVRPRL
ncbi:hypothetical protein SI65_08207 [Aspergillus cristatus]|uniref:N-acetyltransferase domain-containing protein n=1 Tax=Aspergillus cristatus TaxID=573508 RepID=A0A1E3B5P5_ASPCR|nr:hypothetical protein SI65_08207 [Aspergillus cristatus]